MDRGFFMADGYWTCYRRNYFQVSSTFLAYATTPSGATHSLQLPCLIQLDNNRTERIVEFYMNISARPESGGKPIELIQHTAKRDKGPQEAPKIKFCVPENMDDMAIVDSPISTINSLKFVTFERLQFRSATANNGKRRAAQQFHVLTLELFAVSDSGESFKIATSDSPNLIVRGRAPGHYSQDDELSSQSKRPKLGGSPQKAYNESTQQPLYYSNSMYVDSSLSSLSSTSSSTPFQEAARSPEIVGAMNPSHEAFISAVNQLASSSSLSSPPQPPPPPASSSSYSGGGAPPPTFSYATTSFSPLQSHHQHNHHETPSLASAATPAEHNNLDHHPTNQK
jgi:hypothetical protein